VKQKKIDRLRATAERLDKTARINVAPKDAAEFIELAAFALAQVDRLERKKERSRGAWPDESNPVQHGDDIPQPGEIWEFWQLNGQPDRIVIPKSGAYPKTMFRKRIDR
jgi:hypothetical protein